MFSLIKQIYLNHLGCQVFYYSLDAQHREDPKTISLVKNVWSGPDWEAQWVGVYT